MASRRVVQSLDGYVDHMASAPSPTLFRHFAAGVGKRRTPGGQLVEHRSHRKESRPRVDDAVARLFGRHVRHRAHDLPASVSARAGRGCLRKLGLLRQSEIQHLRVAIGRDAWIASSSAAG